jgi:hypothetical protein
VIVSIRLPFRHGHRDAEKSPLKNPVNSVSPRFLGTFDKFHRQN